MITRLNWGLDTRKKIGKFFNYIYLEDRYPNLGVQCTLNLLRIGRFRIWLNTEQEYDL